MHHKKNRRLSWTYFQMSWIFVRLYLVSPAGRHSYHRFVVATVSRFKERTPRESIPPTLSRTPGDERSHFFCYNARRHLPRHIFLFVQRASHETTALLYRGWLFALLSSLSLSLWIFTLDQASCNSSVVPTKIEIPLQRYRTTLFETVQKGIQFHYTVIRIHASTECLHVFGTNNLKMFKKKII